MTLVTFRGALFRLVVWDKNFVLDIELTNHCLTNNEDLPGFVCDLDVLEWLDVFQQYCNRFISFMDHDINAVANHNFSLFKMKSNNSSKSTYP